MNLNKRDCYDIACPHKQMQLLFQILMKWKMHKRDIIKYSAVNMQKFCNAPNIN